MDPSLRELRYFVAVADHLHFTKAAAELGIAQPTLTRQIQQLERRLGATLLHRHQRTVALTVAGRRLLDGARQILSVWDSTAAELAPASETLRIGVMHRHDFGVFEELRRHSSCRLTVVSTTYDDPTVGLGNRQADVAIVLTPLPRPERFRWRVLRSEPRWVLLPDQHRLAGQTEIRYRDLADDAFIALPEGAGEVRDFWVGNDVRSGTTARIGAEASTADERIEAVELGRGVCLLPESEIPILRWPGTVVRKVADLPPAELALAWRADDRRAILQQFLAETRTLPA